MCITIYASVIALSEHYVIALSEHYVITKRTMCNYFVINKQQKKSANPYC